MKLNFKSTTLLWAACLFSGSLLAQSPYSEKWTLEKCVEYAKTHNLTIKRQELELAGQNAGLRQSKAALLPTANMNSSIDKNFGRQLNTATNEYENRTFTGGDINAGTSVTIFNGFRLRNTVLQQKRQVEASRFALEKAKNDISMNVVNAYLNVIFNQELLENAKFQLASTEKQLERTEILAKAGSLPVSNVLELKAQKANLEFRLVNAENSLTMAFLDLKQILQLPSDDTIDIEVPRDMQVQENNLADMSPVVVYETALQIQPEIKSADKQLESAKYGVKIAKGNYSPRLSFNAGIGTRFSSNFKTAILNESGNPIGYEDTPLGEQFSKNLGQRIGLSLSIPIFNGLQTRTGVQRANITLQQAELNSKDQEMQLRQTIERAYNDALAASKNYDAAQLQVSALEEAFRVMEERHAMGSANSVEYFVASNNLNQAKSDLLRAKYEYIFKVKLLDFYQGNSLY